MATKQTSLSLPGALNAFRNKHLLIGIAVSTLIHALVLALRFTLPDTAPVRTPTLDVILVNARHSTAPKNAQALAQANLDGGGNSDQDLRIASPLPPQEAARDGNDLVDTQRGRTTPQRPDQQQVLTREGGGIAVSQMQTPQEAPAKAQPVASGEDATDTAAMALQLEGEIAAKTEAYNKRPRKRQFGARTAEHRFASYIEAWRRKAERIGELNYPPAARGKLYGNLLMTVAIRRDGTIESIVVNRPSQYAVLNEAAVRIVRMGEPYAVFPPNIASDTDIIEISRTWTFTNDKLTTSRPRD
ncbi:MAG: TonB family protein [Zoogloeaceae bacterium]|jgi:protein TonB|nr:TonB family protein [Zoogloeaceae bacterium]